MAEYPSGKRTLSEVSSGLLLVHLLAFHLHPCWQCSGIGRSMSALPAAGQNVRKGPRTFPQIHLDKLPCPKAPLVTQR
eukprot:Skav217363  [mRNA]  locus=scaffold3931:56025:56640:+ [translate_table: standard]